MQRNDLVPQIYHNIAVELYRFGSINTVVNVQYSVRLQGYRTSYPRRNMLLGNFSKLECVLVVIIDRPSYNMYKASKFNKYVKLFLPLLM